ncbi:MAG: AtpZ/AtpI family protein [Patescibacteria group bacterium]
MQKDDNRAQVFGLALQMGYLIAIPLVVFALVGRWFDRLFGSSPLFFLIGVFLAITASTVLVYRKTTALLKDTEDANEKHKQAGSPPTPE